MNLKQKLKEAAIIGAIIFLANAGFVLLLGIDIFVMKRFFP
jgi:hypothetical protein